MFHASSFVVASAFDIIGLHIHIMITTTIIMQHFHWFTYLSVPLYTENSYLLFMAFLQSLTANPGVTGLIPARPHTFMEIEGENTFYGHFLPLADSRRAVVSYM